MGLYLLAAPVRVMFIAMLIIMIIVTLLFGYIVFMILKTKKSDATSSPDVKQLLVRRESRLVAEIMATKGDDEKKNELLGKLRKVKSAQMVVDELLKEEAELSESIEAEEKAKKNRSRDYDEEPVRRPAQRPNGQRPAQNGKKPAPKKKDDMEFRPSDD